MKSIYDDKLRQIESLLQETAGMDDASLLKTAADARQELEKERRGMTFEEADRMEQKARLEADILMARLEEKGIRPITTEEYEKQNKRREGRRCKGKRFKAGVLATAVLGVILIGGISSIAKSEYRYAQYPGQSGGSAVIRYNTAVEVKKDELDKAYDQIAQELGIPVMMLSYVPEGMAFFATEIDETHIVIKFLYNGKYIYLREDNANFKRTLSITESDRIDCFKVYNEWINDNIQIEENKLKNGDIEYSANIKGENAFYYLSGVMEREEFVEIVKNLCY